MIGSIRSVLRQFASSNATNMHLKTSSRLYLKPLGRFGSIENDIMKEVRQQNRQLYTKEQERKILEEISASENISSRLERKAEENTVDEDLDTTSRKSLKDTSKTEDDWVEEEEEIPQKSSKRKQF